jgi:hypothetical protein
MSDEHVVIEETEDAIRAYKALLAAVIEKRPSGTRQRLADELGKNRSFVTQIASPAYSIPIPERAHPGKAPLPEGFRRTRHLSITVADLGDDKLNAALDRAIADFVHRIAELAGKGGS